MYYVLRSPQEHFELQLKGESHPTRRMVRFRCFLQEEWTILRKLSPTRTNSGCVRTPKTAPSLDHAWCWSSDSFCPLARSWRNPMVSAFNPASLPSSMLSTAVPGTITIADSASNRHKACPSSANERPPDCHRKCCLLSATFSATCSL
jgi:hypothetical protein